MVETIVERESESITASKTESILQVNEFALSEDIYLHVFDKRAKGVF